MRKSDIKWQCIRLVAFVVKDVKELVVLDDHDAAVLRKLVQPEGSCQVAHLFNSVLVDQGEGMLVLLDDQDFIGHWVNHDEVAFEDGHGFVFVGHRRP